MNSITISNIRKHFNRKTIFQDVSFDVQNGDVFGITGKNGSGKSTLLKIIAGVLTPTKGNVEYKLNGSVIQTELLYQSIGFLSPYLQLFDEFSAHENIQLYAKIRNRSISKKEIDKFLEKVGLPTDRKDPIRGYSSGMKQRMKIIFAILHSPDFLLLDEPTTNLDSDGIAIVYSMIDEFKKNGCVIIATNDQCDIDRCTKSYNLTSGKAQ